MIQSKIILKEEDLCALRALDSFLPSRIFDSHAHIFDSAFLPQYHTEGEVNLCDGERYFENMHALFGEERELVANFIPFPDGTMRKAESGSLRLSDAFMLAELDKHPQCVGEIMVLPRESESDIVARLTHPSIRGFKCYSLMAESKREGQESLDEFLPESAISVANARGMAITIHLMREGLADSENLDYITKMAKKYPNAKLILAHSARAFSARTLIDNIDAVAPYENIFFDFSAICESPTFIALLLKVGSGRCMWGSDHPNNLLRGKAISVGSGFEWLFEDKLSSPWLYATENLFALKEAATILSLKAPQIEDVFYNTAEAVFS